MGRLVLRLTYITNLQVVQNTYIMTMNNTIQMLLARWLRRLDSLCEVLGSILLSSNFLLVKNMYKTIDNSEE